MKITLTLLLVTLTTFSGKPTNIVLQKEVYELPSKPVVIEKIWAVECAAAGHSWRHTRDARRHSLRRAADVIPAEQRDHE